MIDKLGTTSSRSKRRFKHILLILAFSFLIVALINPQMGTKLVEAKREGIDIVIAVDLSMSMMSEDITPNRLMKTKYEVKRFMDRLEGDRIALVGFTSRGFIQCPLTTDYGAARMFLDLMNPGILPQDGTSLADALITSQKAFGDKDENKKLVILISDGEDHEQGIEDAVKELNDNGIVVFTIGIGSIGGAPIPVKSGFLKDDEGNVVVSKLNELSLRQIATETGGNFYRAASGDSELEEILKEIGNFEKKEFDTKVFDDFEDRFRVFIFIALALLFLESLISYARREK